MIVMLDVIRLATEKWLFLLCSVCVFIPS